MSTTKLLDVMYGNKKADFVSPDFPFRWFQKKLSPDLSIEKLDMKRLSSKNRKSKISRRLLMFVWN